MFLRQRWWNYQTPYPRTESSRVFLLVRRHRHTSQDPKCRQWSDDSPRRSTTSCSLSWSHSFPQFWSLVLNPFMRVNTPITELISRLQDEASSETRQKAYCYDEMSTAIENKGNLKADIAKHSSRLETEIQMIQGTQTSECWTLHLWVRWHRRKSWRRSRLERLFLQNRIIHIRHNACLGS